MAKADLEDIDIQKRSAIILVSAGYEIATYRCVSCRLSVRIMQLIVGMGMERGWCMKSDLEIPFRLGIIFYFLLFILLFLPSCVALPKAEFGAYREAFQDAARAGEVLLDKVAPVITDKSSPAASTRRVRCVRGGGAYPLAFCPDVALVGDEANEAPEVQVRRLAYRTIARYNALLADLAEGKAPNQLTDQAGELVDIVDLLAKLAAPVSLGPAFSLATAELRKITKHIADVQAADTMRSAIIQAGPPIKTLLEAMKLDTADFYQLYMSSRQKDSIRISAAIGEAQSAGNAAALPALRVSQARIAGDINAYHESLAAYVRLNEKTQKALDVLIKAARSSQGDLIYVRDTIATSIEIRKEAENFWKKWRELR